MRPVALRLVIVDDDAALAHVVGLVAIEALPAEHDMVTLTATSVDAARSLLGGLAEDAPVVVISDHHLPPSATTGLELLQEVRERVPAAKRVLMTGRERHELEPHLSRAGLDGFLPKPFTMDQLQPVLEKLVGELRRARRLALGADAGALADARGTG